MDPLLGQIQIFGFNFAPPGWLKCDGQLLPIAQNTALFSLLGTTYGGDGFSTFALPDLRGRVPVHQGNGPGLSPRALGSLSGLETTTLNQGQMPSHTHTLFGTGAAATHQSADGRLIAETAEDTYAAGTAVGMSTTAIGNTGSSIPFNNMQPYLTLNYCIARNGIFPSPS